MSTPLDLHLMKLVDAIEEKPVPVAVFAEGMSVATLAALRTAAGAGWMKPVLVGSETTIQGLIRGEDLAGLEISEWETPSEALGTMLQLATLGSVKALAFAPSDQIAAWDLLQQLEGDPFKADAHSFGLSMVVPETLGRPLFLTDTVVHAEPDVETRITMLPKLVDLLKQLGISEPRVAMLTAVEVASPGLPATMDAQAVAAAFEHADSFHVQGPLSMDLAISEHAAKKKKATGEVPGKADLLNAPNLTVARGILHAWTLLSDTPAATLLLGGPVPLALPDASEGEEGLVRSLAFAVALATD
ncbi:hypothetical protein KQI63_12790 [bacterium]|nr:hypothetical protein [bacterium]